MGANFPTPTKEYARPVNWLLGLTAALLAAIFALRGWAYPLLLALLFGAVTGGIATLNLAPHERYLRGVQARQAARRTGLLIGAGQLFGLGLIAPRWAARADSTLMEVLLAPLLATLFLAAISLLLSLAAGRFGDSQARRVMMPRRAQGKGLLPLVEHPDWVKERRPIPAPQFSPGANHDFAWYFEGELSEPIRSLLELLQFLQRCEYIADNHLFMREDFWQHPVTFEQIRKGDCEDSALWAWRRLKELGIPAELVSGIYLESGNHHAWVNAVVDGQPMVVETTRKRSDPLISLHEAFQLYRPHVSVDHQFNTYRFAGADRPVVSKKQADS